MGSQIARSTKAYQQKDFQTYFYDYPSISSPDTMLHSGKMFKTALCNLEREGNVVVKLYIKRDPQYDEDLTAVVIQHESIREIMDPIAHPNVHVGRLITTQKAGVFIRQYFENNLHQRFLKMPQIWYSERLWFAYQLISAVNQLHEKAQIHGDLKPDNVMLTSWGWLVVTDISRIYKPTYIDEDDMATTQFFFQTRKNQGCCIAPERFRAGVKTGDLRLPMDVFSLGCILAEIFTGDNLFTWSQLLAYRRGEFDPQEKLVKLENEAIRNLILQMIALAPENRKHVDEYYADWQTQVFPACFEAFLFPLLAKLIQSPDYTTADNRILHVKLNLAQIEKHILFQPGQTDAVVIILNLILTSLRMCSNPMSKITAIELCSKFSEYTDDEIKLRRILPYIATLMTTKNERSKVKHACLEAMTALLGNIRKMSPADFWIFDEYIWPTLFSLKNDASVYVRSGLAQNLGKLAESAQFLMELSRSVSEPTVNFDKQLNQLQKKFMALFKELYSKESGKVHAVLASQFGKLSEFLGLKTTNINLIPLIIPWLSKPECCIATLNEIPRIVKVVGIESFLLYIYPCIDFGIYETDEQIVYYTLKTFRKIDNMPFTMSCEILQRIKMFLVHPNQWLQKETKKFIKALVARTDTADNYCRIRPILLEFFSIPETALYVVTDENIDSHLLPPVRRSVYESYLQQTTRPVLLQKEQQSINWLLDYIKMLKKTVDIRVASSSQDSPVSTRNASMRSSITSSFQVPDQFRPEGRLICCLNENNSAVTSLSASKDALYFASASNDSTVKIWDLKGLRNFTSLKAKETIDLSQSEKSRLRDILWVENQVVVAVENQGLAFTDIEKPMLTFKNTESSPTWLQYINEDTFVYTTKEGTLNTFDMRMKDDAQVFKFGPQRGVVLSMCYDEPAMFLGSATGYFMMYDMRFNVMFRTLLHSKKSPIHSLAKMHSGRGQLQVQAEGSNIFSAVGSGGFEVSLWNCDTANPLAYITVKRNEPLEIPYLLEESMKLPSPDNDPPFFSLYTGETRLSQNFAYQNSLLHRYNTYIQKNSEMIKNWTSFGPNLKRSYESKLTVRKVVSGRPNFIITGGSDTTLRYWDLNKPAQSCRIDEMGDHQRHNVLYQSQMLPNVFVIEESETGSQQSTQGSAMGGFDYGEFADVPADRKIKHNDDILDIELVQGSYGNLIISSGRCGTIRIWN